jgi:hypothetical protein
MNELMTKHFAKWASRQRLPEHELAAALSEVQAGVFEANLGGHLFKKRIRFEGQGKSGGGRTIICYKKDQLAIFLHGFAKNEKEKLSQKELYAFKEFAKILLNMSAESIAAAVKNGDFIEMKP